MFHTQGAATARQSFSLLAAVSASVSQDKPRQNAQEDWSEYPFPEFASSGYLEVQTLTSPTSDEFSRMLEAHRPHLVCFRGEQLPNKEIGSFRWGNGDLSSPKAMAGLFNSVQPTMVYLETSYGEEVAEAIHSKGVPFVIFWKNSFSCYAASHFSHALFSVFQSSSSHPWDAFKLSEASFRLYCVWSNVVSPSNSETEGGKQGPYLLGDPPIIDIVMPDIEAGNDEDAYEADISAVKIHDEEGSVRFLLCGAPCPLDDFLLGSLEDGLNALLNIELRGSKLHNRFSAPPPLLEAVTPPLLEAATFSRGVVTMKCDISTCSSARISLLVSGSAQSCFDYQLLENHIKKEIIERRQLVHTDRITDENNAHIPGPRTSASIACGAPIFEVCLRVPAWAMQVLRQLAPETSYRNLVALGIASVQGLSVASFSGDDAKRLLFFSRQKMNSKLPNVAADDSIPTPSWLRTPAPCCRREEVSQKMNPCSHTKHSSATKISTASIDCEVQNSRCTNGFLLRTAPKRKPTKLAPMRPIPHTNIRKMMLFPGFGQLNGHREAGQVKTSLPFVLPAKSSMVGTNPAPYRKLSLNSHLAKQFMSLNPIPLKKHGCGRAPIHSCSEEEFVKDVMQFLILRGHTRLIPQGGLADFPDAILNSKRLDLYNLYREVVSRGGFHVGNGINWKGQVFSKMSNYTATNKMTGVGNTLKRHYETYLLEYELSHDDADGECCLLCHSSAAGDWVNCGICGEWAHFGCDRRQGLGAFKDYAKTDGLEYICPQCSVSNFRKLHKPSNGYSEGLTYS